MHKTLFDTSGHLHPSWHLVFSGVTLVAQQTVHWLALVIELGLIIFHGLQLIRGHKKAHPPQAESRVIVKELVGGSWLS